MYNFKGEGGDKFANSAPDQSYDLTTKFSTSKSTFLTATDQLFQGKRKKDDRGFFFSHLLRGWGIKTPGGRTAAKKTIIIQNIY